MLANYALTTLERMKVMLGLANIDGEHMDEILELLINRTSAAVEHQIGRCLGKKVYHQWYDAEGGQELFVSEYPIVYVEYIKENGITVAPDKYDYVQNADTGIIYRDDGWLMAGYHKGLAYDIVSYKRAIEISYTAGYVLPKDATDSDPQTLPSDLEGAVMDMVADSYTEISNGSHGISSWHIGDVQCTFSSSAKPEQIRIINSYKRY